MPVKKHGYPRSIILKNSREITLRLLDPGQDEKRLLDFYKRIPSVDRWYLLNDVSDQEVVRKFILEYDPRLALPIIALDEQDEIRGKATLYRYFPGARGHVARVRVVLDPWMRNQRLGTYMLLDLIQLGVNIGLKTLVAEFIVGVEDQAIRAARRLDFFEQATLPAYAMDPRGNCYDLSIMMKRLHRGYDDF